MRVYVGERDPQTGVARVWVVHEPPGPALDEIVDVLSELHDLAAPGRLDRGDDDHARRRVRAVARKEALVAQLESAAQLPAPVELVCRGRHSVDGFGWGGHAGGSDLAFSVLRAEIGEDPPQCVYRKFRGEVLDAVQDSSFRLPADAVWAWIDANRRLVERELFEKLTVVALDDIDDVAFAVTDGTGPPGAPAGAVPDAAASAVVRACEDAWADIRRHHPALPDAVIVLGSGVERGRLVKLGHWWAGRWIADGRPRGEVLLAGEALHLDPGAVFEVLLHEAAHGLSAVRGVKDTSRGGRYHNARFAAAAREVGLSVAAMPPYGLARTSLLAKTRERYAPSIARLGEVMRIARQLERGVGAGAAEGGDADAGGRARALAVCGCRRKLRVAPTVLAAGPIVCGLCQVEFTAGVSRRPAGAAVAVDRFTSGVEQAVARLRRDPRIHASDPSPADSAATVEPEPVAMGSAG